jgi:acyl carrier protein
VFARTGRLFDEIPAVARIQATTATEQATVDDQPLLVRLAAVAEEDRTPVVREVVLRHTATVMGYTDPAAVATGATFLDLGFSSLTLVELTKRLMLATGLELLPTLFFDHATVDAVSAHLTELMARAIAAGAAAE